MECGSAYCDFGAWVELAGRGIFGRVLSVSTIFFFFFSFWIDLIGLCVLCVSSAKVIGCELSCPGRFGYLAVAVAFVANSQWLESPSFS